MEIQKTKIFFKKSEKLFRYKYINKSKIITNNTTVNRIN